MHQKKGDISPPFILDIDIQSTTDLLFFYPLIEAPVNTADKAPEITLAGSCS